MDPIKGIGLIPAETDGVVVLAKDYHDRFFYALGHKIQAGWRFESLLNYDLTTCDRYKYNVVEIVKVIIQYEID